MYPTLYHPVGIIRSVQQRVHHAQWGGDLQRHYILRASKFLKFADKIKIKDKSGNESTFSWYKLLDVLTLSFDSYTNFWFKSVIELRKASSL